MIDFPGSGKDKFIKGENAIDRTLKRINILFVEHMKVFHRKGSLGIVINNTLELEQKR